MTEPTDLIDRYFDAWNEPDAERRRVLIARTFAEQALYLDPMLEGEGHDGIDAMIAGVQQRFPGHRFRRTGAIETHHDRARFSWELGPEDGPAIVGGTDFAVIVGGRLRAVTGFFDKMAA